MRPMRRPTALRPGAADDARAPLRGKIGRGRAVLGAVVDELALPFPRAGDYSAQAMSQRTVLHSPVVKRS